MELEEGVIKDICNKIRNWSHVREMLGPWWEELVGWVFIVSNLHFVSELV